MSSNHVPWYRYRPKGWTQFQLVPLSRLGLLLIAVFLLFSVFGLFGDFMAGGTQPYAILASDMVYCGLVAIVWVLTVRLLPLVFLVIPLAVQFGGSLVLGPWNDMIIRKFDLRPVDGATGIRVCAYTMMTVVIASYVFFISFIRSEGKDTFKLRNELELAHGIQKTLVPPFTLRTAQFEIYGISKPSEKVGGDLVDALALANGDAVAYVGDIAGHGLQAGILMGMLKTAARTVLRGSEEREPHRTLPVLLGRLNTVLPEVKEAHMYATFTAFRLGADGSVYYAMAASPPILHWHASGLALSKVEEEQFPLGLLPVAEFNGQQIEMARGDLFAVATDGILEICSKSEEEFGVERMEKIIAAHAKAPLPDLAAKIVDAANHFGNQADDQTILLVRRL